MKIVLVGNLGHIGCVFPGLRQRPDAVVVAVVGGFQAGDTDWLLQRCHEAGQSPRVCRDLPEALEQTRPDIVCVDGPFAAHAAMAMLALQHGAHVFLEKPAALTEDELRALRKAVAASNRRLMTMMEQRFAAPFATAIRLARQGAIGPVRLVHAQKSYKLGQRPDFYKTRATFGGLIPWVGVHAVDLIHAATGQRFEKVMAWQSRRPNFGYGELETSAVCEFLLTNETMATVNIDYLRPIAMPTHGDDRLWVVGEMGVLEVREQRCWLNGEEQTLDAPPAIFAHFLDVVAGRAASALDHEEIFEVTAACLAARRSADCAALVELEKE